MRREISIGFLVVADEWKIDDPQEVPTFALDLELIGDNQTHPPQHFPSSLPLVRREENQIPFFDLELRRQRGLFGVAEKLYDRRLPFAAFNFDEREALCPKTLRRLGELLDLPLRRAGESLRVDCLDHAAGIHRAAEHFEFALRKILREIDKLNAKTR